MRAAIVLDSELLGAARLGVAGLIGLGAGLEREWSGHADGPLARFAGIRTFLLLGLIGGAAGLAGARGLWIVASVLVLGGVALSIAGYLVATRQPGASADGTTEVAAIAV